MGRLFVCFACKRGKNKSFTHPKDPTKKGQRLGLVGLTPHRKEPTDTFFFVFCVVCLQKQKKKSHILQERERATWGLFAQRGTKHAGDKLCVCVCESAFWGKKWVCSQKTSKNFFFPFLKGEIRRGTKKRQKGVVTGREGGKKRKEWVSLKKGTKKNELGLVIRLLWGLWTNTKKRET